MSDTPLVIYNAENDSYVQMTNHSNSFTYVDDINECTVFHSLEELLRHIGPKISFAATPEFKVIPVVTEIVPDFAKDMSDKAKEQQFGGLSKEQLDDFKDVVKKAKSNYNNAQKRNRVRRAKGGIMPMPNPNPTVYGKSTPGMYKVDEHKIKEAAKKEAAKKESEPSKPKSRFFSGWNGG